MKRWNGKKDVEVKRVDHFLAEVLNISRRYGLSIEHEDRHGAFLVTPFNEASADWLRGAGIRGVTK